MNGNSPGRPIASGVKEGLADAVVSLGLSGDDVVGRTVAVRKAVRVTRSMGSSALSLAYVANGRFDAFAQESGQSAWDVAAAGLIAARGGALVTDFAGADALDKHIATLHGMPGPKVGGVQVQRDYNGDEGRRRAALDMVSAKKTRYATPLASAILALNEPQRRVPKLVAQLFDVIGNKFGLSKVDPATIGRP